MTTIPKIPFPPAVLRMAQFAVAICLMVIIWNVADGPEALHAC